MTPLNNPDPKGVSGPLGRTGWKPVPPWATRDARRQAAYGETSRK